MRRRIPERSLLNTGRRITLLHRAQKKKSNLVFFAPVGESHPRGIRSVASARLTGCRVCRGLVRIALLNLFRGLPAMTRKGSSPGIRVNSAQGPPAEPGLRERESLLPVHCVSPRAQRVRPSGSDTVVS